MPTKRDYYEVLNISRQASADEIKRAYRKLALKFHPDNYKGDKSEGETKFKELAESYEALSDPSKRQRYDQFGHEGLRGAGMHDFSSMGFGDIFSIFSDIFGGGGDHRGVSRGLDLETEVEITLEQAAEGLDRTLEFERRDLCDTCSGSGAKAGTTAHRCRSCDGHGQVQQQVQSMFGMSVRVVPCPACHGKGKTIDSPCGDCRGSGRVRKGRVLSVHIPAGISDGQVVRARGEGEPNDTGTSRGDLHVYVSVKHHPLLTRRGDDLICQVPISFSQAAMGGVIHVPTLKGEKEMAVPAGTQNGDIITEKQMGLPSLRSGRKGALHIQVFIEVPKKLSQKQRQLLEEYAETEQASLTPQRKTFFDKVKDYFSGD